MVLIKLSQDFVTQKYNLHIYNDTIKMPEDDLDFLEKIEKSPENLIITSKT